MEESVNWQFDVYMQEMFHMKEVDLREYSPLTLAYIGDCIYDVIIKSLVVNEGISQSMYFTKNERICAGVNSVENDAHDAGTFDRRRACSV